MSSDQNLTRDAVAELIGTFMLVFIGAGAGALGLPVYVVALAHGLALIAIIYTYGHISGAHVNPAITLSLFASQQITITRAAIYWAAQFVGGVIAALAIKALVPIGADGAVLKSLGETTGSLTAAYPYNAMFLEFIFTFILASVVIQAAAFGRAGHVAGVGIGLTLAACIIFGGTLTGASLNPARTFGPALVAGNTSYVFGYLVAIFSGGAVAGCVQNALFESKLPVAAVVDNGKKRR